MNKPHKFLIPLIAMTMIGCQKTQEENVVTKHQDSNGFSYETVANDPTGLRLYTLDNGLKVYLSKNEDEPKIQTFIAVRAGSVYDPADNTGLAHYLEHMVFKGTHQIGTQDWEAEKVYLDLISDLYEQHKAEQDPEKKKAIYRQIDSVSYEASKLAIANEYDKMVSSLGAEGTNAWTWHEETVYTNKIPANELEKWMMLESERFSQLVLRLFHTELEAVYEEFNRAQDNDFRKEHYALMDLLFPNHPYGQQTTIGISEHLKNPSMVAIHDYFDRFYVPNNMAVVLVGDLDFEASIQLVDKYFGKFENKNLTHPERPVESALTGIQETEVFGPEAERVTIGYRTGSIGSEDEELVTLVSLLLTNGTAGLIDLNLNQKQLVQRAYSSATFFNDYGIHTMNGYPRGGQTLEEVKELLLSELNKIKNGEFEDWMLDAVINDLKLREINRYDNASALANTYVKAFVQFQDWDQRVAFIDNLRKYTKEDVVNFAKRFYADNYAVVYKRMGESTGVVKVDNPGITPIELNRDKKSNFLQEFEKITSPEIEPVFVDYKEAIQEHTLNNGIVVSHVENDKNDLMYTYFIYDIGKDHNKLLALAAEYMTYVGTDTYSAEDLKKEFYKIGVRYGTNTSADRTSIYLTGLKENLPKGIELLQHLWEHAQADQEAYDKFVEKIEKDRQEAKTNRREIMFGGLMNMAMYGENSSFRDIYTLEELRTIQPEDLVAAFKDLKNYPHRVFYYGKDLDGAVSALNEKHQIPAELKELPEKVEFFELATGGKVYFVDYDMVQAEMMFLSKGDLFSKEKMGASSLFNSYFGSGLSSIVFQEIRESKSLAYSAYAFYRNANEMEKPNYIQAYIGTQANKIPEAVEAMLELLSDMPENETQFENARQSALKQIAATRITKTNIFWSYENLKKRGIDYDIRKDIYKTVSTMTLEDLRKFFNENIQGGNYTVMVLGNKKDIDQQALRKLGTVEEVDLDFLFNYQSESSDPLKL